MSGTAQGAVLAVGGGEVRLNEVPCPAAACRCDRARKLAGSGDIEQT
jgi:hypothetical protein